MLSRRNALRGTFFAALARAAEAQVSTAGHEADIDVFAPDGAALSLQVTGGIVARLGGVGGHLYAEPSRGVADAVGRLDDRPRPAAALLPSTALAFLAQTGSPSQDVYAHRYIAQLDVLTLQALASRRISNLRQLAGQKVALGPLGSPTQVSAAVLLSQIAIRVDPVYLDHQQACAAVIHGDIPAMMFLGPKPARLFLDVDASDDVHFIPLPEPKGGARASGIIATQILPTDYPMIVAANGGAPRGVSTVAIPMVMGCFGWAADTPNFIALARLADLLAERGSGLPGFDMAASVSGWKRFAPVEDWLAQGKSGSIQDYAAADTRPAISRQKPTPMSRPAAAANRPAETTSQPAAERTPSSSPAITAPPAAASRPAPPSAEPDQKEKLFQEFLNWRRNS